MSDVRPRRMEVGPQHEARHFWRPSPLINRIVDHALQVFPLRTLTPEHLAQLQAESHRTFLELGALAQVLDLVVTETSWTMSDGRSPSDAWGGEVLRPEKGGRPEVVLYRDSPLTRLPSRYVFGIAAQLAVDHMYGHLYPYYSGEDDWGEEVACRWQYLLLKQRGRLTDRVTARIVALTHRAHKQIPLSTYG